MIDSSDVKRTPHSVVKDLKNLFDDLDYIGLTIMPMPSIMDPNDENDGDFLVHVYFLARASPVDNSIYVSRWEQDFPMGLLVQSDEAQYDMIMNKFHALATKYSKETPNRTPDQVVSRTGVKDGKTHMEEVERRNRRH